MLQFAFWPRRHAVRFSFPPLNLPMLNKSGIAVYLSAMLTAASVLAQDQRGSPPGSAERRTVTAVSLEAAEKILLDGRLDEPAWKRATPATDFIQQLPDSGAPPTERTEVRFAFSRDALYMGVTCLDDEPNKLHGNTMKRDEFLRADDRFMWIFDTFLNAQSGYYFEMNPSGLMGDALMGPSGQTSREWDGIWDAQVRRSEIGWTIEIEIPFRTLNFDPNSQAWGVNFQRTVRRKNEESLWTGWGLNQGLRAQYTGLLLGLSDVTQGHGLDIKPYGAATALASPGRGSPETRGDGDIGVDLHYSVTPALRASLTVNTDFAQTEVDQRQVNLTQYSLFFPEKRDFFLQGASFFDFASFNQQNFGTSRNTAVVPFFTRRIGLNEDGEPQQIELGAKLIGQMGRQDVGILQIRTAQEGSILGEDFTALRFRQRMLRESYIGMLYTRRDARGGAADSLHTVGVDYRLGTTTFRGSRNLETSGYILRTTTEPNAGKNYAYGLSVDYPNDRYVADFSYREVQENYDPALGFTLRNGYRRYAPSFRFQPRPRSGRVRQYQVGVSGDLQLTTKDNDSLFRQWDFTLFRADLHSQDSIQIHYLPTYERLDRDFTISRDVTLRNGTEYDYSRYRVQFWTADRRVFAIDTTAEVGSFYSGDRRKLGAELGIRPRRGVVLLLYSEWNRIDLPQGKFTTRLYRTTLDTQFSPWISLTSNLQYDSVSTVLGWQSRFRWIITPGNDLYFVYNHNWLNDPILDRFSTLDRRAATKIVYTYRL